MQTANFPGRKNRRRLRAFQRFPGVGPSRKGVRTPTERLAELMRLRGLIIADQVARSVRTKKDRTNRAKLARAS